MYAAIWITISAALIGAAAMADTGCRTLTFDGAPFTVCEADPQRDSIRLYLNDENGDPLGSFSNIKPETGDLAFAMNAGMYHLDRSPVGLYIENGTELARIITSDGPGNFGLLPNGVLCLTAQSAAVIEARSFKANPPNCTFATQSGPMLVIDGALHPAFLPNSTSRNIRNGVGVTPAGKLVTAISDRRVTFHHFARLFRDHLNTPNALFLDGSVSRLYAPDVNRNDIGLPLGPMLGVTKSTD